MDPTYNHYNKQTKESYSDFDWNEFVEKLYAQPPCDPFTFRLKFLDGMNDAKLSELLGNMLIIGVKQLYNKQIAELNENEICTVQKYYRSIGFEVEYLIKNKIQYIAELGKTMPVSYFQIDFKPCSQALNDYNKPEKIIP